MLHRLVHDAHNDGVKVFQPEAPGVGGGGVLPEKVSGGVRPTSKTLTPSMNKISIPYSIYDLI